VVPLFHVEKRKPSFDLEAFKTVCGDPQRLKVTVTAALSAASLGFDQDEMATIIRSMKPAHFHKSMTSYGNHRKWQDVYHVHWDQMVLYVKFTDDVVSAFTVLFFKER
jgi:motility quorum-sensing regulator/GCU-specific mRNA interferase toxin